MNALKITNNKIFMAKLLTTEAFDHYKVEEITIETFNTFSIDGHINREFYKDTTEDSENIPTDTFSLWSELRPTCLNLIKGKRTPVSFKFVFHADDKTKETVIAGSGENIDPSQITLGINIRFSNNELLITTGTAYNVFTLDKSIEKAWDNYFPSFLESCEIDAQAL
ncbi:MAG: hypothetical protein J5802_06000 [Butyrivibrio sp.]|nr:hypothetical protein [Butyrivibrio sp.]